MRIRSDLVSSTIVLAVGIGLVILAHVVSISSLSGLAKDAVSSLHAPGFGAISAVLMLNLRRRYSPLMSYGCAALIATVIGLFSEAAQIEGPRNAEFWDIVQNSIGIIGVLALTALFDKGLKKQLPEGRTIVLSIIAVPAVLATLLPISVYGFGLIARVHAAPTLASFDMKWEKLIIGPREESRLKFVTRPGSWPNGPGGALSLHANPRNRLLFKLEPFPDWSRYSMLFFDASSSNEDEQIVTLAIRDSWRRWPFQSHVFRRDLRLGPEVSRIEISLDEIRVGPESRDLDMSRISTIYILAPAPAGDESISIGSFRLE